MDVYEIVTSRIVNELENGIIPWKKPWNGSRTGAYNRFSKKPYSFLNQMLLQHKGEYGTYKQWSRIGGHPMKGTGEMVVFWKPLEKETEDPKTGEKKKEKFFMLRYYTVFHVSNVKDVESLTSEALPEIDPIKEADELLNTYTEKENIRLVLEESDDAYYAPAFDLIHLPLMKQFKNAEEFYATAFHEATHSTLTEERCNRRVKGEIAKFGSCDYSKEELVAEIGSSIVMNRLGIETENTFKNSVGYIQSWLNVLKGDKRFIVDASGKAEKAANYIFGSAETDDTESEDKE